jgi:hypothetical protein
MTKNILDDVRRVVRAELVAAGSSITVAEARRAVQETLRRRVEIDRVYAALETGPGADEFVVTRPPPRPLARVGLRGGRRP